MRPSFGWGFGSALASLMLVVFCGVASAEGWTNATENVGWSNADRFTAGAWNSGSGRQTGGGNFNAFLRSLKGGELDQLMSLISRVESPKLGYDSVVRQARVKPPKAPTQMTLGEIFSWIKATPKQHHAIGRYQVIPETLARVSRELNFKHSTRYDRRTQDTIATFLIMEAGYQDFKSGRLSRAKFMDNLAAIWAGFPNAKGRSVYHGIAGNKATITRGQYTTAMASIFPIKRAVR